MFWTRYDTSTGGSGGWPPEKRKVENSHICNLCSSRSARAHPSLILIVRGDYVCCCSVPFSTRNVLIPM